MPPRRDHAVRRRAFDDLGFVVRSAPVRPAASGLPGRASRGRAAHDGRRTQCRRRARDIDCGIRHGAGAWPGPDADRLVENRRVAVRSSELPTLAGKDAAPGPETGGPECRRAPCRRRRRSRPGPGAFRHGAGSLSRPARVSRPVAIRAAGRRRRHRIRPRSPCGEFRRRAAVGKRKDPLFCPCGRDTRTASAFALSGRRNDMADRTGRPAPDSCRNDVVNLRRGSARGSRSPLTSASSGDRTGAPGHASRRGGPSRTPVTPPRRQRPTGRAADGDHRSRQPEARMADPQCGLDLEASPDIMGRDSSGETSCRTAVRTARFLCSRERPEHVCHTSPPP